MFEKNQGEVWEMRDEKITEMKKLEKELLADIKNFILNKKPSIIKKIVFPTVIQKRPPGVNSLGRFFVEARSLRWCWFCCVTVPAQAGQFSATIPGGRLPHLTS